MWQDVLTAPAVEEIIAVGKLNSRQIGYGLKPLTNSNLSSGSLAIVTVGPSQRFENFRRELYQLYTKEDFPFISDLGTLNVNEPGEIPAALSLCLETLLEKNIRCVVIGEDEAWVSGLFRAMERRKEMACLSRIDKAILSDISEPENWLGKIIEGGQDGFLYKYAHLGYQNYLTDPVGLKMLDAMHFEHLRLGELRGSISVAEPLLRETDILQFSMASIKASEAPAQACPEPNGLYAEEACQIMRYAGMGDHLQSIALTGYVPEADSHLTTSKLIAQMIWHVLDGMALRRDETPDENPQGFTKFLVDLEEVNDGLVFWKSQKTSRWWMQLPHSENPLLEKYTLLPCSYQDYQQACQGELPDRWMRAYSRLLTD